MPLTELRRYTDHTARTATPGQLVVMLYDGFLRFATQGRAAMVRGDLGEAGMKLTRAQDIVTELRATLDMTQGTIAANLASIYAYVGELLTGARLERDAARIDEALRAMGDLRDAWVQIAATPVPTRLREGRPAVGVDLAG
jgi:flagellar secretion chaperone FliS